MNEREELIILRYLNSLKLPGVHSSLFRRKSYKIWAAGEILSRVSDHPFTPAQTTVEYFLMEMIHFGKETKDTTSLCSVAEKTAEEILRRISDNI